MAQPPSESLVATRPAAGLALLALTLRLIIAAGPAGAQCTVLEPQARQLPETIGLLYTSQFPGGIVEEASAMWETCAARGHVLPVLLDGQPGEVNLVLRYKNVQHPARVCGEIAGTVVTLYAQARDERGKPIYCGSAARNLAHEIGHFLGLDHASGGRACEDHIMSFVNRRNRDSRVVDDEVCRIVSRVWMASRVTPSSKLELARSQE